MSDDLAREPFIVLKVDGTDYKFFELTSYDRAEVLRKYKADLRAEKLANCKDAELDKDQTYAELSAFDAEHKRMGEAQFVDRVNMLEGKLHVFELALRREHAGRSLEIAMQVRLTPPEELDLVCRLCNLRPAGDEPEETETHPLETVSTA